MKKKNGFTLVELLAVIVILAIILVIAIPQIIKTIDAARLSAFRSSAKMLLKTAEKDFLVQQTLDQYHNGGKYKGLTGDNSCERFAKLTSTDYEDCKVVLDANGVATLSLTGAPNSKFNTYGCNGVKEADVDAKDSATNKCTKGNYAAAKAIIDAA